MRIVENANPNIIVKLLENIISGIKSMIEDYTSLYSEEEIVLLESTLRVLNWNKEKVESGQYSNEEIREVLECENILKPLAFRCFVSEYNEGGRYISWLKEDKLKENPKVISSTFSKQFEDTFCDMRYGISYEVSIDGFLGACNKDAATIIEDKSPSLYTIGKLSDQRVVNSYNLATPIITPIQVFDKNSNDYKSKHNEIILDSRYIRPKSVVYMDENDLEMVNLIGLKYGINIEKVEKDNYDINRKK